MSEMERGRALTWVAGDRGVPQGQAARSGASHTMPSVSLRECLRSFAPQPLARVSLSLAVAAAEPSKEAHETEVS